jgi:hypothetical protein
VCAARVVDRIVHGELRWAVKYTLRSATVRPWEPAELRARSWCFSNQTRAALPGEVAPKPLVLNAPTIL